jgi:hypothetical protein
MGQETTLHESHGSKILEYSAKGPQLGNVSSSLEIISTAYSQRAQLVAIPVERLGDVFFQLREGIAGEVLQKFATYCLRIAIVGDITSLCAASKALHDFVVECNRGSAVWFVRDLDELKDRLRRIP